MKISDFWKKWGWIIGALLGGVLIGCLLPFRSGLLTWNWKEYLENLANLGTAVLGGASFYGAFKGGEYVNRRSEEAFYDFWLATAYFDDVFKLTMLFDAGGQEIVFRMHEEARIAVSKAMAATCDDKVLNLYESISNDLLSMYGYLAMQDGCSRGRAKKISARIKKNRNELKKLIHEK